MPAGNVGPCCGPDLGTFTSAPGSAPNSPNWSEWQLCLACFVASAASPVRNPLPMRYMMLDGLVYPTEPHNRSGATSAAQRPVEHLQQTASPLNLGCAASPRKDAAKNGKRHVRWDTTRDERWDVKCAHMRRKAWQTVLRLSTTTTPEKSETNTTNVYPPHDRQPRPWPERPLDASSLG